MYIVLCFVISMVFTGPRHRSSQIVGSNGKSSDTAGAMDFDCVAGNIVTPTFLPLALIACMVGLASVFAGANHLRVWRSDSLSSAASTSLIAWLLTLLAMGVACKEIHTGGSNRQKRLKTLEAFIIILAFFELLYLLSLQAGFFRSSDVGYTNTRATNIKTGTATYGTPAATAV
ncbi:hypothetical protein KC19_4G213500 [Ceratodon purpureus]|uniref:Uncharacterized protein n=1 Tax=Ceratodon purpureus TaxID=3225 RepID=A0A8T0IDN3_CERPU|nr:hypothetical protein KC19_4G213500 [Ceratodon purpureus]